MFMIDRKSLDPSLPLLPGVHAFGSKRLGDSKYLCPLESSVIGMRYDTRMPIQGQGIKGQGQGRFGV